MIEEQHVLELGLLSDLLLLQNTKVSGYFKTKTKLKTNMHLNCFSILHEAIILKEVNWRHCGGNQWKCDSAFLKSTVLF